MRHFDWKQALRYLPLLLMGSVVVWMLLHLNRMDLSLDAVLNYTPKNLWLAVLFLWLAYALKSMTVFFPILALFAASGVLFPLPMALVVNTVGIAITVTLPYLVGRATGRDVTEKLLLRYPRLRELRKLRQRNNFFFSFIVRALGILSCDIVSLYFGSTRLPYGPYLAGAVLGFVPEMICGTVAGMALEDLSSPWFYIAAGMKVLLCALSLLLSRHLIRRSREAEA